MACASAASSGNRSFCFRPFFVYSRSLARVTGADRCPIACQEEGQRRLGCAGVDTLAIY